MSFCRKITDWYICIMLLVFPLFTGFRGYAALTNSKFYFLLGISLIWLLTLAALSLYPKTAAEKPSLMKADILFLGAFVLISALSAILSPWFPETLLGAGRWDGLVTTLLYAAIYLGIRCFGEIRQHHLWCFGASVLICAVIGIGQLLGNNPLRLFPGTLSYHDAGILYSGEFLGTIGNVDILAAYLCLAVPLFIFSYVGDEKNAPLLLPAAAGSFLLLESGVRSGLIGLVVCALFAMPLMLNTRRKISRALLAAGVELLVGAVTEFLHFAREGVSGVFSVFVLVLMLCAALCFALSAVFRRRSALPERDEKLYRRIFLGMELLTVCLGLMVLWLYPGKSGTLYELSRILHGEMREEFGSSRIRIWRETLALVRERPLLGGGPGSISRRLSIHFSRFVPESGKTLQSFVDNAHNVFLAVLTDTGIVGLLSYLGLLTSVFVHWIKNRSDTLCAALGCAVIGYCAEEFFGLGLCISAPLFWLLLALCAVRTRSAQDAPEGSSRPEARE